MVSSEVRHTLLKHLKNMKSWLLLPIQDKKLLNKRSELFGNCRHENKYLLKNFRANDKGYLNILTEGKTLIDSMTVYL